MIIAGLIGYPLKHSHSPELFRRIFKADNRHQYEYQVFELKNINELRSLIHHHPSLIGLNVTIPHKEKITAQLDAIDEQAEVVGAVNTISIKRSEENLFLKGYNTDIYGFEHLLHSCWVNITGALILGSGGASKAVSYILKQHNIPYLIVSRSNNKGDLNYLQLNHEILQDYPVVINCTPAGTYPKTNEMPPIPPALFSKQNFLIDLIYNPNETKLLKEARARGAQGLNGELMLEKQAKQAWEIWNKDLD
ncbi:MAG: shikimate dehydrogenase [Bacteroidales bacterium]|nr:shikimate dehydrogenase [Bacteroidales bacterium]